MTYAEILFAQKVGQEKDTLTYKIPPDLKISVGDLVKVPLRSKFINGIVWEIHDKKPSFRTLEIKEKIFEKPLFNNIMSLINPT